MDGEKQSSWFCELTALFGYISLLCGLYWIFSRADSGVLSDPATLQWYVCTAACFFALRLYLRKERTVFAASIFAISAFAIQTVVLIWFSTGLPGFIGYAFAFFFWAFVAFKSYSFNLQGIALTQMTMLIDGCAVFLILMLFYQQATALPAPYGLPLVISVFLCLVSLTLMRTAGVERGPGASGFRGFVVILCLLLLLGACILAFLIFASAPVGEAVVFGYHALVSGIVFVLGILGRILLFLLSLLPEPEGGEMPGAPAPEALSPIAEENFQNPPLLEAMLIFLGVAALVVLVLQLVRLRGIKVGGRAVTGGRRIRAAKGGAGIGRKLRLLVTFLLERFTFFWMTVIHRSTPPGLLVYLERWARLHKQARLPGETHRRFLLRLCDSQPPAAVPLRALSDALDAVCYGPTGMDPAFPKEQAAAIRRSFRFTP
jgi:hypothetical protein